MLSLNQYQILNACCDDVEIFYFPFAQVNFGGQLFHRAEGENYAQYVEDQDWPIRVHAPTIIAELVELVNDGFLECWKVDHQRKDKVQLKRVDYHEFAIYEEYDCKTFDEHLDKYDYGPHEFYITLHGRGEMDKREYQEYDRELGYND